MSVLEFPRIYFQGYISFDPATGNNDDYGPVYDAQNCVLNYDFMATSGADMSAFGVDSKAFGAAARQWMVNNSQRGAAGAEWNYFGGNGARFIQFGTYTTTVTGGVLPDGTVIGHDEDPVVGATVELSGDSQGSPGRLVDCVSQTTSTSIVYARRFSIDGEGGTSTGGDIVAPMHSLFLGGAGLAGTWQTSIAKEDFGSWSGSKLVSAFTDRFDDPDVLGVTVRFLCSGATFGSGNGTFNDIPDYAADLNANYVKALAGEIPFFSSPSQSRVLGVLGVWRTGEPVTMTSDRRLVPVAAELSPFTGRTESTPPPNLTPGFGVASVASHEVEGKWKLSIELTNATQMQRVAADANLPASEVYDYGPLTVKHGYRPDASGSQLDTVTTVSAAAYREAFRNASGIVDVDIDGPIDPGLLVIGSEKDGAFEAWSGEDRFVAIADIRDGYVNSGDIADIEINVYEFGRPAPQGVQVRVLQYVQPGPWLNDTFLLTEAGPSGGATLLSGNPMALQYQGSDPGPSITPATVLTVGEHGTALLRFRAGTLSPIFVFQPYSTTLGGGMPPIDAFDVTSAMFASRRVYPGDAEIVQRFCNLWNSGLSEIVAGSDAHRSKIGALWNFLYFEVLVLYDVLFPVMRRYFDMDDQASMEQNIEAVLALTDKRLFEQQSTTYMPITRDLSDGKRDVIKLWAGRVRSHYALDVIDPSDAAGVSVDWQHPPF